MTNCEIADLVGSTPETVSKALNAFCQRSIIVRNECGLDILDPQGLQEWAEEPELVAA